MRTTAWLCIAFLLVSLWTGVHASRAMAGQTNGPVPNCNHTGASRAMAGQTNGPVPNCNHTGVHTGREIGKEPSLHSPLAAIY